MAFEVAALGDSIMWGQGLSPNGKFTSKVKAWLENKLQSTVNLQLLAHSGATIARQQNDNSSFGSEVPTLFPSIISQIQKVENPDNIDLVILNGGINDLSLEVLLNPLTNLSTVKNFATNNFADLLRDLFKEIINKFPNTPIIFTGYYPIISKKTDVLSINTIFSIVRLDGSPITRGIRDKLADLSITWSENSAQTIKKVVNEFNQQFIKQKFFFAQPLFEPENSYGALNTFLWSLGQFDEVTADRIGQCTLAGRFLDPVCLGAPTGHPNTKGSDAFAVAIEREIVRLLAPPIVLQSTSIHAPSAVEFNSKPLVLWSDTSNNHNLRLFSASSKDNWEQETILVDSSFTGASLCFFKNKLYLVWCDKNLSLKLKSSSNSVNWTDEIDLGFQTLYQPSLTLHQNKMFLSWISLTDNHKIHLAFSDDGINWVEAPSLNEASIDSPALASFNGQLFLAWNNPQIDNQLSITSSSDNGQSWQNKQDIKHRSASAPYLYSSNKLHLAWAKKGLMPNIRIAHSVDGIDFSDVTRLYENSDYRPTLMNYFGSLAALWTGRDRENHMKLLEI